jgi:gamma-glutamyltranspeptidase
VGFESSYALSDPVAAHVAIMDKNDNYVSVVTSLNTWFGSKVDMFFVMQCEISNRGPKLDTYH